MPSRTWSHLCDYATIDANGKSTIVGDFERITVPQLPVQFPLFFVISKWNGYTGEWFTHCIRVISPTGQEISASAEVTVTIQGEAGGDGDHLTLDSFMMIELHELGQYAVEIVLNGNPVHILPLTVYQIG